MEIDSPPRYASALAKVCVVLTFLLILVGAFVTTSGAGMAVPNAPHVGGTLLNPTLPGSGLPWYRDPAALREHGHRLVAMTVGVAVGALAAALWRNWLAFVVSLIFMGAAEGTRAFGLPDGVVAQLRVWPAMVIFVSLLLGGARARKIRPTAEQWLALVAYVATCLQALFGTLRVELDTAGYAAAATDLRTFHGIFAQAFLALLVALAARLSPIYRTISPRPAAARIRRSAFGLLILYFLQLACAAYLRHRPGSWAAIGTWPVADPATGSWLPGAWGHVVGIHFLHSRVLPVLILGHTIGMAIGIAKRAPDEPRVTRLGWTLLGLVMLQIALGVSLIWTHRQPHITNTHVIVGAMICAGASLLFVRARRFSAA